MSTEVVSIEFTIENSFPLTTTTTTSESQKDPTTSEDSSVPFSLLGLFFGLSAIVTIYRYRKIRKQNRF